LTVGIYQMISGTRTRIAKKIFGTLLLDKETSACISARVAGGVAKDEHKSREFCPFCGSSNVSEPETEFNSLTGAIECDSCGAIWLPPRSKNYAWIIIVCCAIAIPCAIGFLLMLYLDEDKVLPFISFLGLSLVAIFMSGVLIYLNTQVLRGKRGKFKVHRPSLRKSTAESILSVNLTWLIKMITVYVLQGKEKHYVGITNNLARRLAEHRAGRTKGAQIIKEFVLLHTEQYPDYISAREREKFFKSGAGREYLEYLKERSWSASGG